METFINLVAPVVIFFSGMLGLGGDIDQSVAEVPRSVEFGLTETSPRGAQGGFAMPASGCSSASPDWHGRPVHDCNILPDISTDKAIIRLGEDLIVSWDPRVHTNCVLSGSVMTLVSSPNPATVPNGDIAGSRTDMPSGEVTYSITCEGEGNADAVTVKVLPRFQET